MPQSDQPPIFPFICTPSHDGKLFANYVLALINFTAAAAAAGLPVNVQILAGESLITRARNNCVAKFLANPQYTHLFWIDSDIGFSVEAAMRLLNAPYDISAGVYPLKMEFRPDLPMPQEWSMTEAERVFARYTVNASQAEVDGKVDLVVGPDGFMAMDEAPTGFMVIRRSVLERMVEAYPELQYVPDSIGTEDEGLHYRFFDCMIAPESGRYLSEDYYFCRLWQALGGKVHIDANSNLSHQGSKTYRGDFAYSLQNAIPHAVGAKTGAMLKLVGGEYLKANPPGPF